MEKLEKQEKKAYARMKKNWEKLRQQVHMQIVEKVIVSGGIHKTAA